MKKFWIMAGLRAVVVIVLPFCMLWAFIVTLVREIGNAFWYAHNSSMQEWEASRRAWSGEGFDSIGRRSR